MRVLLGGRSRGTYEARREVALVLPHLASEGCELVDGAPEVVLSYGHPTDDTTNKTVVRWDRTCDSSTMRHPGLSSVIFSSRHERDTWSYWLPSHVDAAVCHGAVDTSAVAAEAPPGLASIRGQFDLLYSTIKPLWEAAVEPEEAASVARRIGIRLGKRVGLVVVGELSTPAPTSGADVFYVDWLSNADMSSLLSLSTGLLCPHRSPEVPSCVLEALVQGTAVVHWGQASIVEVVGGMGHAWDDTRDIQKYPWDLSGVSTTSASQIFLRALLG